MEYVEIRLPKCRVYLTDAEIGELLKHDIDLFKLGLKKGAKALQGITPKEQEKTPNLGEKRAFKQYSKERGQGYVKSRY